MRGYRSGMKFQRIHGANASPESRDGAENLTVVGLQPLPNSQAWNAA